MHDTPELAWDDLRLFLAVVDGGSLSAAARRLRVAQPTISRRIAELERVLAEPLFTRGKGGTHLTPFAERLVDPARRMAEAAGDAARAAEQRDAPLEGVVRITAAPGVNYDFLVPFAAWMKGRLPGVRLELISTLAYLDLGRREADLALRLQKTRSKELVCLAELDTEVGAYASASYARRLPRGYGVADVDWIAWAPPFDHLSPNPELARVVPGFRPAFASDDVVMQIRAAEEGLGAIILGRTDHRLKRLALVELDLDLGAFRGHLQLLCVRGVLAIPRVRAVADLLAAELRATRTPKRRKASGRA